MELGTRKAIEQLLVMQPAPLGGGQKGCGSKGGNGKPNCGSAAGQGDLSPDIWEKVKNHPCYSEEAHHHYARMHVAVAPACNIQCHYCNRKYDCSNESRPGVVSERLTPEQAARKVLAVASEIPQMTVLGIAGPGDPLANPEKTFKTFELVTQATPDIKLCLSTNGLVLPEYVDRILALNIDHVTITINMVDPEIGAKIYPWIYVNKRRYEGVEAARILSERQLLGLEMLTERGILCKVNSVMIPGVNDHHLAEVNKAVKSRGAFLHNIMPLISAPEHGTVFGLNGTRGPTAQELKALQDSCEGEMNMMRHCRQCRADAGESDTSKDDRGYTPGSSRKNITFRRMFMADQKAPQMQATLGLTGLTSNAMALIAPGAFLWLTFVIQAGTGTTAPTMLLERVSKIGSASNQSLTLKVVELLVFCHEESTEAVDP